MARHHPNTAQGGPVPGQAPQVASVKVEEDANLATGQNRMIQSRPSLVVKLKATVPVAKNGRAAIIQDNGGSKGPRGGGFGLTFPMADIRSTGNQGLTIISGHPSVPSSFGGNYPDIVKQRVPTQYKRGVGMDFNFEDHMPNMEACNFAEDVKDHAEYEFIDQGEFIDDGEFIVHGESIGHGEFIVHGESLDDSECIVHGESIGHGESLDVGEFVGHGESVPGGEFIGHDDPIDDGEFIGHGESIDDGSQEDLLASSETDTKPSTSFRRKTRQVFTRWIALPPRTKGSRVPLKYRLA